MSDTATELDRDETPEQRHHRKMAARKVARDKIMAEKTQERGLIIVHTGSGKGKSTAAFGMAVRSIGHGFKVAVVQFIKGAMMTAERDLLVKIGGDLVSFRSMGEGFTWETQDRSRDIAAAQRAWDVVVSLLDDPTVKMVILDEINVVLRYGYLDLEPVLAALASRPVDQHVVLTGRGAPEGLIDKADLVTEMTMIKHPFRSGVKAQAGVEF